jgi:hypothetical protein
MMSPEEKLRAAGATFHESKPNGHTGGNGSCAPASGARTWPEPMALAAFHGLAGELVAAVRPHTEADDAALLLQFLAAFGNSIGRGPYVRVEGDRHGPVVWPVLVGDTAKARKGTSFSRVREVFEAADPEWLEQRRANGLSSGEGLVWAIRDPIMEIDRKTGEPMEADPGVRDKRLLVVESEFANVLRQTERSGNTLSATLRDAWDGIDLRTLTKNNAARASRPHVTVVGHITAEEIRRYLTTTEAGNGFANRFLFVCVRRARLLPFGGGRVEWRGIPARVAAAIQRAREVGEVSWTEDARAVWRDAYPDLSNGEPGMLGAVTARMEAQALRLALIYALLDGADAIAGPHLRAALAVVAYCRASARHVFGDATGDPVADTIADALQAAPAGLTRTEIHALFGRNATAHAIERALAALKARGMAESSTTPTGGRPTETWRWRRA